LTDITQDATQHPQIPAKAGRFAEKAGCCEREVVSEPRSIPEFRPKPGGSPKKPDAAKEKL